MCRVALHLQLAASHSLTQDPQHNRAVTNALPSRSRAVDSVQTRQSSAERDLLAEQQERSNDAAAVAEYEAADVAIAAEAAVLSSCAMARQVLEQLQGLGSAVTALMVSTFDKAFTVD